VPGPDAADPIDAARDATVGVDAPADLDATVEVDGTVASDAPSGTDAPATGVDATGGPCGSPPRPTDPIECYQSCTTSADCVWVDSACCCNCFNGGPSEPINSAYASQYAARRMAMCAAVDCSMIGCLAVVLCPDGPPSCIGGRCAGGAAP
jgi:hypothetical protein